MKTRTKLAVAFLLWLGLTAVTVVQAQTNYSIDYYSIDGGGGTSTSDVYSVRGTVGQPDVGSMFGGDFTVEGGFWSVIAIQTPGAPLLSIRHTVTNTVAVSWPSPSTGWDLQQNTTSLSAAAWSNVTATIQDDGTNKTLIVNPPTGNRFYRLIKP